MARLLIILSIPVINNVFVSITIVDVTNKPNLILDFLSLPLSILFYFLLCNKITQCNIGIDWEQRDYKNIMY